MSAGAAVWDQYRYKMVNGSEKSNYHNPHLTSQALPEVLAFLKLYGVEVLAVTNGRMFVSKKFSVAERSRIARGWGAPRMKDIIAANDGPLHAPLGYWQLVCKSLLDYAVQNGYEEPANGQQSSPQ